MRPLTLLFLVLFIGACGASASGTPSAASATASASAVPAVTTIGDCPVTKPGNATPPPLPAGRTDDNAQFARTGIPLFVHFNDSLAVRLPMDGTLLVGPGGDGAKLGWLRLKDGPLVVSAQRLDVPGIVRVDMADNYGNSGLQVTGIRFGGAGCYSVTGSVGTGAPLTFVALVAVR